MRAITMSAAFGLVVALAACDDGGAAEHAPGPIVETPAPVPTLPDGWRWESYHDVEVGVPGDFGHASSGRIHDWCASRTLAGAIGRPGPTAAIRCWDGKGADPGAILAEAG